MKKAANLHIAAITVLIIGNYLVLNKLSKLDMLDFWHMLHDIVNFWVLAIWAVLLLSQIALYIKFSKHEKEELEKEEKINETLEIIVNKVTAIADFLQNEIKDHSSLKEELSKELGKIPYSKNFAKNAIFNEVVERIIEKIADNYVSFKKESKLLNFFSIEKILKELRNILQSNSDFIVDFDCINELSNTLLLSLAADIANKKKDEKSKDFIKKYFKVFISNLYRNYQNGDNSKEAEKEHLKSNVNKSKIKGNENSILQDLNANTINISLNKK